MNYETSFLNGVEPSDWDCDECFNQNKGWHQVCYCCQAERAYAFCNTSPLIYPNLEMEIEQWKSRSYPKYPFSNSASQSQVPMMQNNNKLDEIKRQEKGNLVVNSVHNAEAKAITHFGVFFAIKNVRQEPLLHKSQIKGEWPKQGEMLKIKVTEVRGGKWNCIMVNENKENDAPISNVPITQQTTSSSFMSSTMSDGVLQDAGYLSMNSPSSKSSPYCDVNDVRNQLLDECNSFISAISKIANKTPSQEMLGCNAEMKKLQERLKSESEKLIKVELTLNKTKEEANSYFERIRKLESAIEGKNKESVQANERIHCLEEENIQLKEQVIFWKEGTELETELRAEMGNEITKKDMENANLKLYIDTLKEELEAKKEVEEVKSQLIIRLQKCEMKNTESSAQKAKIEKLQQELKNSDNSIILLSEKYQILKSTNTMLKKNSCVMLTNQSLDTKESLSLSEDGNASCKLTPIYNMQPDLLGDCWPCTDYKYPPNWHPTLGTVEEVLDTEDNHTITNQTDLDAGNLIPTINIPISTESNDLTPVIPQHVTLESQYAAPPNRNYNFLAGQTQLDNITRQSEAITIRTTENERLRKLKQKKENKEKKKDKNVNVYTIGNGTEAELSVDMILESLGEIKSSKHGHCKKRQKTTKSSIQ